MNAAELIRNSRKQSGLTLRALAERANTSHATLAAYEHGRVIPRFDTVARIVAAAGFALDTSLPRRRREGPIATMTRGEELEAVLQLASEFPTRHHRNIGFPVFGR